MVGFIYMLVNGYEFDQEVINDVPRSKKAEEFKSIRDKAAGVIEQISQMNEGWMKFTGTKLTNTIKLLKEDSNRSPSDQEDHLFEGIAMFSFVLFMSSLEELNLEEELVNNSSV